MKRMRYVIGTLILVMMVVLNLSFTSNAYTEEEKQQAKAWLSAHGYSPDMGGAGQAYQDYLNGKFDEELGVDVNGDGIPSSTEAATVESGEVTTQASTEIDAEETGASETTETTSGDKPNTTADNTTADNTTADNTTTDNTTAENKEERVAETVKEADETSTEASHEVEDQSSQEKVEAISAEEVEENSVDDSVEEESTLYQPEKEGQYTEAAIVIAMAVVLMLLAGLWLKQKK